jgi:hypothetical protein
VAGWKAEDGAIVTGLRGPVLVFDTVFERPPRPDRPPIRLDNPPHMLQQAVVSNVSFAGSASPVDPGPNGEVRYVDGRENATIPAATTGFLRSTARVPRTVIDVRSDCGARGDGRTDDTAAVQACLDRAARIGGPDTLVYFPSGRYRVSRTIRIADADYLVGGTGWHSQIVASARGVDPVVSIVDPQGLVIEHLGGGGVPGTATFEQRGTAPGSVLYRGIYAFDSDEEAQQSIRMLGLPAGMLVLSDHLDGRLEIRDSAAATLLLGFAASVRLTVGGAAAPTGLIGLLTRASALEIYPLEVEDNQTLVVSDWYNEQTPFLFRASGPGAWAGSITLDLSRAEAREPTFARVDGYRGRVVVMGGVFGVPEDDFAPTMQVAGSVKPSVGLMVSSFWNSGPRFSPARPSDLLLQNSITTVDGSGTLRSADKATPEAMATASAALDDLRALSDADLRYNGCLPR